MKIILVFVSTLDGKVTKWGDPFVRKWSSKEDKEYFSKIWNESELIVVGSRTYDADRLYSSSDSLIVVMTSDQARYKDDLQHGKLEFSDESPSQLVSRYSREGSDTMLVAGGPHIATAFLKEQLVDELWLTLEPKIFGRGDTLAVGEDLDVKLQLLTCEKVNEQGTLITKYKVLKK